MEHVLILAISNEIYISLIDSTCMNRLNFFQNTTVTLIKSMQLSEFMEYNRRYVMKV